MISSYSDAQYCCNSKLYIQLLICTYIHIMCMIQVIRSVDGTMTSSTAAGVDENKSKREQIINEVVATETAYIKDLTDIIHVSNNNN